MRLRHNCARVIAFSVPCLASAALAPFNISLAQSQSSLPAPSNITIVLPPKLVLGRPATLAVFGADDKLAPNVDVDLNGVLHVRTNSTGRVSFLAPSSGNVLIAKAEGASAAALLDPAVPASSTPAASATLTVAPIVSLRDRFPVCGPGLRGDANENRVKINVEVSLILAASPECLVILAPENMPPGPARISVETPDTQLTASTILASLAFGPPNPPLLPGKSGVLALWVQGTDQRLRVVVTNASPGVLSFAKGNEQQLLTTGGPQNFATMTATALSSGDFSLRARLLFAPDVATARRFLEAAVPLAAKNDQVQITKLAKRLARHPRDAEKVRVQLSPILSRAAEGDLRILLDAASHALE